MLRIGSMSEKSLVELTRIESEDDPQLFQPLRPGPSQTFSLCPVVCGASIKLTFRHHDADQMFTLILLCDGVSSSHVERELQREEGNSSNLPVKAILSLQYFSALKKVEPRCGGVLEDRYERVISDLRAPRGKAIMVTKSSMFATSGAVRNSIEIDSAATTKETVQKFVYNGPRVRLTKVFLSEGDFVTPGSLFGRAFSGLMTDEELQMATSKESASDSNLYSNDAYSETNLSGDGYSDARLSNAYALAMGGYSQSDLNDETSNLKTLNAFERGDSDPILCSFGPGVFTAVFKKVGDEIEDGTVLGEIAVDLRSEKAALLDRVDTIVSENLRSGSDLNSRFQDASEELMRSISNGLYSDEEAAAKAAVELEKIYADFLAGEKLCLRDFVERKFNLPTSLLS